MCVCVSALGRYRTEERRLKNRGIRGGEEGKGRVRQRAVMGSAAKVRAIIHQ